MKTKVPQLKKPKGFGKLKGLGKRRKEEPLPKLDAGPQRVEGLVDEELRRLTSDLGDEKLAKKLQRMKQKYPDATFLELAMMEWFDRKRVRYVFQQWLLGGRAVKYGQVTDFIIDNGTSATVIEAQGSYWHNRPGARRRDRAQRFALLGLTWQGKKILKVVEVWESKIMQPNRALREQTMQRAVQGIEVGK